MWLQEVDMRETFIYPWSSKCVTTSHLYHFMLVDFTTSNSNSTTDSIYP